MITLSGLNEKEVKELLPNGLILLGYRGSIAHGTYRPQEHPNSIDDKDIMGVFIPPLEHYFGLDKHDHHERFIHEWDSVCYEICKYVSLLMKSNPNVPVVKVAPALVIAVASALPVKPRFVE